MRRREVPDGNHEFSILWWISWASSNGDTLKHPGHGVTYRVVEEGTPAYLVGGVRWDAGSHIPLSRFAMMPICRDSCIMYH